MKSWVVTLFSPNMLKTIRRIIRDREYDIKLYCPLSYHAIVRRGKLKIKRRPLLFNYMFMRYDLEAFDYKTICELLPVRPLLIGNKTQTVPYSELQRIKLIARGMHREFGTKIKKHKFDAEDYIDKTVQVRDGTLSGVYGRVSDVKRNGVVQVDIFMFNRVLQCDMDVRNVELTE